MFWRFDRSLPDVTLPLEAHHQVELLVLAASLAILGASTLLPVIERYRASPSARAEILWLMAGALAMGCGVWAMHFTAMVAHQLPVAVSYDPLITLVSFLVVVLGAGLTIRALRLQRPFRHRLLLASLALGSGVGLMHYIGMEAIQAPVHMIYHPGLFLASLLVVGALAWLGLWSNQRLMHISSNPWRAHFVGSIVLGLAVTGMHMVAMEATRFYPAPELSVPGLWLDSHTLSIFITLAVLVVVGLLLLAVAVDRHLSGINQSLNMSEKRFQRLAESSESAIFSGAIYFDYINPAMCRITGYSAGELQKLLVSELLGFDPATALSALAPGKHWSRELAIRTRDGRDRWLYLVLAELDTEGQFLGSAFDITERKRLEEDLRRLAYRDPLTDLHNRQSFMMQLDTLLESCAREQQEAGVQTRTFAVMVVDVNRLRLVNDNFGISTGDQLLAAIARRLRSSLPEEVLIARVAGDEFALLFPGNYSAARAQREAETISRLVAQVFLIGQQEFFVSVSIGVTLNDGQYRQGEDLYRDTNIAQDAAKQQIKNHICLFDARIQYLAQQRLELESDLRRALSEGQFELFYQPIVALRGKHQLKGFEALLRWRKPGGEYVFPADFIALAEESGLINLLGNWVLEEACRQLQSWNQLALEQDVYVSVNLSSVQFYQTDLISTISGAMSRCNLKAGQLKLELTESVLIDDSSQVVQRMHQMLDLGCAIMVDDFGTGYSSLSYLQSFPLSALKIDQSFVADIHHPRGRHLVDAIIAMAHALGLEVIAEGIETQGVAQRLVALGCLQGQGYYFAYPMPADQATEYLLAAANK